MTIQKFVVTADQMRQIETRIFAAGMPVAALMEKVALLIALRIQQLLKAEGSSATSSVRDLTDRGKSPEGKNLVNSQLPVIGVLVGPGHNGGDALVVARELHFLRFQVVIYCPFSQLKELTKSHADYARSLNIPFVDNIERLKNCDLLVDGLFGFGLEREITNHTAAAIDEINNLNIPVFSIDIPSGIHTDTGEVLGTGNPSQTYIMFGFVENGISARQSVRIYRQFRIN
jgi:NAD(P)H-hydrate epimerase